MHLIIASVADLGLALRAVRKANHIRLDDLAAIAGVSKQFVTDVEHGKPTIQMGLVFKLLQELGVPLVLEMPTAAEPVLRHLKTKGLRPLKPRGGPG